MSDHTLLSEVPEIHGRAEAGVNATNTGQKPPNTSSEAPPANRPRQRLRGADHSHATVRAGTTKSAAPILASKPSPTHAPATSSQRTRPSSSPRTSAHSAPITQSTSSASGLLWRETVPAIGVSASTAPAAKPPARPKRRATRSYTSATDATPISACGTRTLSECQPKIRTDSACTHSDKGGLSTVMTPVGSSEPNTNAC